MYLLLIFDVPLCGKFMWGLVPEKSHLSVPKHCIGKRHLKCHIHVHIITRKAKRQNIPKEKGVTQFSTQWTKANKNDVTHLDLMKLRVQDCDNHYYCQQRQWLVFFWSDPKAELGKGRLVEARGEEETLSVQQKESWQPNITHSQPLVTRVIKCWPFHHKFYHFMNKSFAFEVVDPILTLRWLLRLCHFAIQRDPFQNSMTEQQTSFPLEFQ